MIQRIKTFILGHKIITGIIIVVIAVGLYFIFRKTTTRVTRYVTSTVAKGNITTVVTGTGQIEASDTVDLKLKTSGDINYVGVKIGQEVKKGKLIASVDSSDAKMALLNAQITLKDLVGDPDSLTLLQKQNSLTKAYNDGWNTVSSFVTDMNSTLLGIYDIFNTGFLGYQNTIGLSPSSKVKVSQAEKDYYIAKSSIDKITKLYKSLSRSSKEEDINNLINEAYDSSKIISNTVKNIESAFNYTVDSLGSQDDPDTITTRADINSWISSANSYVNSLLSSGNSLKEGKLSMKNFLAGADELDIKSAELSVESKQQSYNDCFLYAPFDGVIATFTAKVGESSGASIGAMITKQKIATISLNEVDIAKIKLGQKVTLTFDAIDELTITGGVVEIDSIGAVSQGVVSYNVKIGFDTGDDLVKPGMSVSASIITDTVQDVLVVSNSAVKSQNGVSYVQTFNAPLTDTQVGVQGSTSIDLPNQVEVVTGLTDDTSTEIISGLKEGDIIVTKTVTGIATTSTSTAKTTTPSIMGAVGGRVYGGPRD
jgi:HlyD family secretion protein